MRRTIVGLTCLFLTATACGSGSETRTVLVDYTSDEFSIFSLANFPTRIEVHPGDTLVIRQTWTGEPHTFTGGTFVNTKIKAAAEWFDFFDGFEALVSAGENLPDPEDPKSTATVGDFVTTVEKAKASSNRTKTIESYAKLRTTYPRLPAFDKDSTQKFTELAKIVDEESSKAFEGLPEALGEKDAVNQGAAQPCYLRRGSPPKGAKRSCRSADQKQPKFDGKQTFYNSGIIPYSGPQGNTFQVPLAGNIKPGSYFFSCLVHGPVQRTEVVVRPKSVGIPSQADVTRDVKRQVDAHVAPLRKQFVEAKKGTVRVGGGPDAAKLSGPFAGLPGTGGPSGIDEFVPKRLTAKVGEPIVWKMMGAEHTITLNPPKYFPPIEFPKNGTVRYNPRLRPPAGGAKKFPDQNGRGVVKFDGGTYDGTGFWSSGLIGAEPYVEYTMRVSKAGTYPLACLIHPQMVGTLVVTP